MIIGIFDTETDGLGERHETIEIALSLFDVERKAVVGSYAMLLPLAPYKERNDAEGINHISFNLLTSAAIQETRQSLDLFMKLVDRCDALLAHNASFDRTFINRKLKAFDFPEVSKPWVCSHTQLKFPKQTKPQKLSYHAVDHGLMVVKLHRAMSDVNLLVELVRLIPDLSHQLKEALYPPTRKRYKALVPIERKDEAKSEGFQWNKDRLSWWKDLSESELGDLKQRIAFEVVEIAPW